MILDQMEFGIENTGEGLGTYGTTVRPDIFMYNLNVFLENVGSLEISSAMLTRERVVSVNLRDVGVQANMSIVDFVAFLARPFLLLVCMMAEDMSTQLNVSRKHCTALVTCEPLDFLVNHVNVSVQAEPGCH